MATPSLSRALALFRTAFWRGLAASCLATASFFAGASVVYKDIAIPARMHSSPVLWRPGQGAEAAVAVVTASGPRKEAQVDSFWMSGSRVANFPYAVERAPVAPGNQIFGYGAANAWWVAPDGGIHLLASGGRGPGANPAAALINTPPATILDAQGRLVGYAAVSIAATHLIPSKNMVSVFDAQGAVRGGYPVALSAAPEDVPPIADPAADAIWILLRSGQVDAFRLSTGARVAGFPTPVPEGFRPAAGFRFAAVLGVRRLVVVNGSADVAWVDIASGEVRRTAVPGGRRITSAAAGGNRIYLGDEGSDAVHVLAENGQAAGTVRLGSAPGTQAGITFMLALPGSSADLLVVSAPGGDTRARVDHLYDQRAPADVRARHSRRLSDRRQGSAGSRQPTAEENAALDELAFNLKRGWLETTLGMDNLSRALAAPPDSRIQIFAARGNEMATLVDHTLRWHTPETGFLGAPLLLPRAFPAAAATTVLVPLNAVPGGPQGSGTAPGVIRAYTIKRD